MFNYRKSYAAQARLIALRYIARDLYHTSSMKDVVVDVTGCQRDNGSLQVVIRCKFPDGRATPWLAVIKPDNQNRVCIVGAWNWLLGENDEYELLGIPASVPENVDVLL